MISKAHQDGVTVAFLVLSCFRVRAETCEFTSTNLPIKQTANQPTYQPVGQVISHRRACAHMGVHSMLESSTHAGIDSQLCCSNQAECIDLRLLYARNHLLYCSQGRAGRSGAGQGRAGQAGGASQYTEGMLPEGRATQHTAQHGTAQHSTAQHGTARHGTARHGTARHGTARHGTARHSTAQHSMAQHAASEHPHKSLASMSHLVLLISQELL